MEFGYSELAAFFQSTSAGLECLVSASLYFDKSSLLLLGRTTQLIGASLFHLYACSREYVPFDFLGCPREPVPLVFFSSSLACVCAVQGSLFPLISVPSIPVLLLS